jgi:hypothetical protein
MRKPRRRRTDACGPHTWSGTLRPGTISQHGNQ